ncbi:uncharacterized protein [Eurosta solidaginis]|uniref:uncharacterized protein n=1 Tax=Eurosta solidaginis TaxID=178769 RepID=UPI0035317A3B
MQIYLLKMLSYVMLVLLLAFNVSASPLYQQYGKNSKIDIDPLIASATNNVPMIQSNNFETIMPDGSLPREVWQFQNFDSFYDTQMTENDDFNMDEAKFLPKNAAIRPPQPLSKKEREIRQYVEIADPRLEKVKMLKLKKGNTEPRGPYAYAWDQFDYDLYSVNPLNQKRY